jgi:hypothetical protein
MIPKESRDIPDIYGEVIVYINLREKKNFEHETA